MFVPRVYIVDILRRQTFSWLLLFYIKQAKFSLGMAGREQAVVFVLSQCEEPAEPQQTCAWSWADLYVWIPAQCYTYSIQSCPSGLVSAARISPHPPAILFSVLDGFALVRIQVEKIHLDVWSRTSVSPQRWSPVTQFKKKFSQTQLLNRWALFYSWNIVLKTMSLHLAKLN